MKKVYSEPYTVKGRVFDICIFADSNKVVYKIYEGTVLIPQFELTVTMDVLQDIDVSNFLGFNEIISVVKQFINENI